MNFTVMCTHKTRLMRLENFNDNRCSVHTTRSREVYSRNTPFNMVAIMPYNRDQTIKTIMSTTHMGTGNDEYSLPLWL